MDNSEQQMISKIVETISKACILTLMNQNIKYPKKHDYVENFLGVTDKELVTITSFVVRFLPQRIYLNRYVGIKNYVVGMIAQKLILFLLQEDKKAEQFSNNIKNLRNEIVNEVANNIYILDKEEATGGKHA